MNVRALLALAGLAAALAGCGGSDEPAAGPSWNGPPRASADGTISVREFNAYSEEVEGAWERSPLLSAAEFLRLADAQAATSAVVVKADPEGGNRAVVTVSLDGLLDDSVRATRYALELARARDGTWRLLSARFAQRCARGRGHQEFSPSLCL